VILRYLVRKSLAIRYFRTLKTSDIIIIIIIIIGFTQLWLGSTWDVLRPRFHVRFSMLVLVGRFPPIKVLPLNWGSGANYFLQVPDALPDTPNQAHQSMQGVNSPQ